MFRWHFVEPERKGTNKQTNKQKTGSHDLNHGVMKRIKKKIPNNIIFANYLVHTMAQQDLNFENGTKPTIGNEF